MIRLKRNALITSGTLFTLAMSIAAAQTQFPSGAEVRDPSFGEINQEQLARMLNPVDDGPFYMINLIKHRERAVYADGRETDLTGRQADALYSPMAILREIGAEVVFVAKVETNLPLPGDGTKWDQVAIVLYPSRKEFMQMLQRPDFRAKSVHKDAGLEKSIVMVAHRVDLPLPDGFVPAEPTYPATAEDSAFEMIHVIRYHDLAHYEEGSGESAISGAEAMRKYGAAAGSVARPMGVHPLAWFKIEGVMIGDGRLWDEMRINHFPSHATLEKHLSSRVRAKGQHHRRAAIKDTYSMQTIPVINTLGRQ